MTAGFDPKKFTVTHSSQGAITLPTTTAGSTYTSAEQTIINNLVSAVQAILVALRDDNTIAS